jgi:hypothetical protein
MSAPDIQLPEFEVSAEECDKSLGVFMRAWDQIEIAIFQLLHKLVDTDITTAHTIFTSGIDLRTMRGIIEELGKYRFSSYDNGKLVPLLKRLKNAATRRNRIVHAHWTALIEMGPKPHPKPLKAKSATWARVYSPPDQETTKHLMSKRNQKARDAYVYGPARLESLAAEFRALARDVNSLTRSAQLLPPRIPLPVEW